MASSDTLTNVPIKEKPSNEGIWARWFNQIYKYLSYDNNHWRTLTPTFTGLTITGTPTYTFLYQKSRRLVSFSIKIDPNGGTIASTLNTTYINNLPYTASDHSMALVMNGTTRAPINSAHININEKRIYIPTIGATANIILIAGSYLTSEN